MQTFLPYAEFDKSAHALDFRRLGKQRVEAYQILKIVSGKSTSKAWRNHPAVLMWEGYAPALYSYALEMCLEWQRRGYVDNMAIRMYLEFPEIVTSLEPWHCPPWIGDERLHSSHRAALLYKDPMFYVNVHGWTEEHKLDYYWPVRKEQ